MDDVETIETEHAAHDCGCGGTCGSGTCATTAAAAPTTPVVVVDDQSTFATALASALARARGDEPAPAPAEPETAAVAEDPLADAATITAEAESYGVPIDPRQPGRFRAVLVVEEQPTDDGRIITRGATIWRDPPLPLMLMTRTQDGHDGAEVAAVIERITRQGAQIIAEGRFDTSECGMEAARLVRDGVLTGVSLDGGNVDWEVEITVTDGVETPRMRINAITLLGASIVPFPAFANTPIQYVTASGAVDTGITGRIEWLEQDTALDVLPPVEPVTLTASGPREYPADYFADPQLTARTPLRIMPADENGVHRIYGHMAVWGECHIGLPGACTVAPRSRHNYAYFRTGSVHTDRGDVPVGTITMDTMHPDRNLAAGQTTAHYDHTGLAAAFVAAGEDAHGIWISGVLAPGLSEERATALAASSLSGDWRSIGGALELVATLAVNVPGFPVIGMRDNEQVSLVAAGYGPETEQRVSLAHVAERNEATRAAVHALEERVNEIAAAIERLDVVVAPLARSAIQTRLASGRNQEELPEG